MDDLPTTVPAGNSTAPPQLDSLASAATLKARVLVVDDDALLRRVYRREIAKTGLDVVEAESGDVALGLLAGGLDVAVVLLDYRMPGTMGDVVLREVRARYPEVAVIMCSGEMTAALAREFERLGACCCLEKPVPRGAIQSAVTAVAAIAR